MPEGLWLRLGLGLLVAVALLVGLQWWVSETEQKQQQQVVSQLRPRLPDPPPGREALAALHGRAASFQLATRLEDLPSGCAPVLAIQVTGVLQVPVAAPLPRAPGAVIWPRVGVLLPVADLRQLSAAARGTLLAVWSQLRPATGLQARHLGFWGCELHPDALRRLLRWVR